MSPARFATIPAIALCLSIPVAGAQSSTSNVRKHAPNASQKQWIALNEPWLDCVEDRFSAADLSRERARKAVESSLELQGVRAFMEGAMSRHSQQLRFRDYAAWKVWLRSQFVEHLVPLDQLERTVKAELRRLEKELDAIDADFLIAHSLDVEPDFEYGHREWPKRPFLFDEINRRITQAMERTLPDLDRAHRAAAVKFGTETLASIGAERAFRLAAEDDEGNVSWGDAAVGFGIGMLADEVSKQALNSVDRTPAVFRESLLRELKRLHREVTDLLIAPDTVMVEGSLHMDRATRRLVVETLPESEFRVAVYRHNFAVRRAVASALGVDVDWTADVTDAALRERRSKD